MRTYTNTLLLFKVEIQRQCILRPIPIELFVGWEVIIGEHQCGFSIPHNMVKVLSPPFA